MTQSAMHKALYGALTTALAPVPVLAFVPENQPYPYVHVDRIATSNRDAVNIRRQQVFIYLSYWTDKRSPLDVYDALETIEAVLNRQRLTLETGHNTDCVVVNTGIRPNPGDGTFQGDLVVRCTVTN